MNKDIYFEIVESLVGHVIEDINSLVNMWTESGEKKEEDAIVKAEEWLAKDITLIEMATNRKWKEIKDEHR